MSDFSKDEIFKYVDSHDLPSKERSQQVEYYFKALISKSMYEESQLKLVALSQVLAYMQLIGSRIRTSLSQVPDRMSPRLAAESDEETVHHLLLREVKSITDSLEEIFDKETFLESMEDHKDLNPVIKSGKITSKHKGKLG